MKMLCDLHTHSTTSDGQYTPSELVSLARQAGIECRFVKHIGQRTLRVKASPKAS